uniref:Uncharacterized protein n=1 Tax=Panagrolaimus sp. JU765 TaxID=591449 RepID=A0AC34Q687_9BILA
MDESNKKKGSPSAVAIQIVGSHDKGNYAIVYDLKDGKVWKILELDDDIKNKENCASIFELLTKECPPQIVKSIFLNVYGVVSTGDMFDVWLSSFHKMGKAFGYKTPHALPGFVTIFTTELLLAKRKGRKYQIGDCVLFAEASLDYCQVHLLKKQEIGWDILDGKIITFLRHSNVNTFSRHLRDFLSKNSVSAKQVKDAFVKTNFGVHDQKVLACLKQIVGADHLFYGKYAPFLDRIKHNTLGETSADYLEISGEYMAKVYAGEEYFTDYDCYIGSVCITKFELQVGSSTILLPVQFKRAPCTIQQKINFNN